MTWRDAAGAPAFRGGSVVPIGTVTPAGAAKLFAGAPHTLAAVAAAAALPAGDPPRFALPLTATARLKTETQSLSSANVAGLIEGSDPVLRGEVIVLTAHLDGRGLVTPMNGDVIANGALDNASGVATLLEAARGFMEPGRRPLRSVLLLAVTAEEKGLVGADYFARNPTLPKASLAANVNLDMPILTYGFTDVVAFGAERSTIGPAVRRAAGRVGIGLTPDPLPEEGLFTRSDHYRFVEQGVPSVFLMTGFANGGEQAFRGFLRGCYHQPCDDMGQPIDYQAAARFARVNYEIARELADGPERPRWNPGDFFGELFAGPRATE
jgi:Zn-dependent M28 family amino/carboxypeptidase